MVPKDTESRGSKIGDAEPDVYEHPEVADRGSLRELTLSGTAPLSDTFGGSSGGGS